MEKSLGFRIRIAHSKTQRDGWGYETTVELSESLDKIESQEGIHAIGERLEMLLIEASVRAERERDRREKNAQ